MTNLNTYRIPVDDYWDHGSHGEDPVNNSTSAGVVDAIFRNLPERLCEEIATAQHVLGCVAWLTHPDVLAALARVSCSIIVQKEDFLRPDSGGYSKHRLRPAFDRLVNTFSRIEMPGSLWATTTFDGAGPMGAVRCAGNHNRSCAPAWPRMHNKFFVFADIAKEPYFAKHGKHLVPKSVWTGSFNPTSNGARSLENAVIIRDEAIATAYAAEFAQIALLSEPLDWESDWSAPEWRIGS